MKLQLCFTTLDITLSPNKVDKRHFQILVGAYSGLRTNKDDNEMFRFMNIYVLILTLMITIRMWSTESFNLNYQN